jgi:DNA-binding CsgD family transcriptional regulator
VLLGREQERQAIGDTLATARTGQSAILALVGEPGIGKTSLLDAAAEHAHGMQAVRARGIESEAQIPFGSLLELLRPALGMLDDIPKPQALALESALALRPGTAQERFAVGAATLSLLAAYAEAAPLAVLIDDAQWLDRSSAQALLFALRRFVADPVAVLIAVRAGEPSLLDGAGLPTLSLEGLTRDQAALLLPEIAPDLATRLHGVTAGNPLAMLELASDADELALAPEGAPVIVSARITAAFLRRLGRLDAPTQRTLTLAAASDTGDLQVLGRAARHLKIDLEGIAVAEQAGLVTVRAGAVEFRHPLARSAIYADAPAAERRRAHRALAAALPDRDVDRRAWHLASAAVGPDEAASAALEQAGARSRDRSAYATAAAAFERSAQLAREPDRRARLLWEAAASAWLAGSADRATHLLGQARGCTENLEQVIDIDHLAGQIATRQGPVMRGYEILLTAGERADGERAAVMLAEAAMACFYAGEAVRMLTAAERAQAVLPADASPRGRFMVTIAIGTARIIAGDAATGTDVLREAVALAESSAELRDDVALLPWLALGPIFLRQTGAGRALLAHALSDARGRAAVGILPFVLNLIARDQATTNRWAIAEAHYHEAIDLAREIGQRTELTFGLSGLAWLEARRGHEVSCRESVRAALELSDALGMSLQKVWAAAALGELELGLGRAGEAVGHFEHQQRLLTALSITDVDLSPAPELVDVYLRLGRRREAADVAGPFQSAAAVKGQPWSLARACRCRGLLSEDREIVGAFEAALGYHAQTPDEFETARTRVAYGARLRRARNRVLAREQLEAALSVFERLDAEPWAELTRTELAATGVTARRRDPSTIDELTPQELQIALLLADGRTTREAAAALFLSPKTVEYHLRHVYQKLGIHSRAELATAISTDGDRQHVAEAAVRTET